MKKFGQIDEKIRANLEKNSGTNSGNSKKNSGNPFLQIGAQIRGQIRAEVGKNSGNSIQKLGQTCNQLRKLRHDECTTGVVGEAFVVPQLAERAAPIFLKSCFNFCIL